MKQKNVVIKPRMATWKKIVLSVAAGGVVKDERGFLVFYKLFVYKVLQTSQKYGKILLN